MKKQARSRFILRYLDDKHLIEVEEIVKHCRVSPITARRDWDEQADQGFLIRTHGGALHDQTASPLFSFVHRMENKREKKIEISQYAIRFIQDNDTIFLDCGTTVF